MFRNFWKQLRRSSRVSRPMRNRPWKGRFLMFVLALAPCLVVGPHKASAGFVVNYSVASTGQTAIADFEFRDADSLVVILTETTPAERSALAGAGAVLTKLAFHLPDGQTSGGQVVI